MPQTTTTHHPRQPNQSIVQRVPVAVQVKTGNILSNDRQTTKLPQTYMEVTLRCLLHLLATLKQRYPKSLVKLAYSKMDLLLLYEDLSECDNLPQNSTKVGEGGR